MTRSRPEHGTGDGAPGAGWRAVFMPAVAGSLLMFAAQPPLAWWPLGWVAPVPWLMLCGLERLPGRRPYRWLWLAGFTYWLIALHWLRLPHPATSIGWIALACYLGCYLPAWIALTRVAVTRLRFPLIVAAPLVWTGLELARGWVLSGFLMASLAHTQVERITLLQISDLGGEFAVDLLMILVAAAAAETWTAARPRSRYPRGGWRRAGAATGLAAAAVTAAFLYGRYRLAEPVGDASGPRVALIQGTSRADWKSDSQRQQRIMDEYTRLSVQAVRDAEREGGRRPDLIVWPETMFRTAIFEFSPEYLASEHAEKWASRPEEFAALGRQSVAMLANLVQTPLMLGIDLYKYDIAADGTARERNYNGVVLANERGEILDRYAKVHLVVFGETIPFADTWPALARLSPLTGRATAGEGPVAMSTGGVVYSPSVCYESVLPRVIRRQVGKLTRQGSRPDVLVNVTNDAWYWGSSELDMHLACDVFRAIETRTPMVVAANDGISAHIDSCGRVVTRSRKQTAQVLLADVLLDSRTSPYVRYGDWLAVPTVGVCLLAAAAGLRRRSR